jgi:hypothetical protein
MHLARPWTGVLRTGALLALGVALFAARSSPAGEPRFRFHRVDARSEYAVATAFDCSGDGRPDLIAGGFWYEAPDWKRHKLRDVEFIRGRFDEYSALPLDVNGDGRLDLLNCNYRSEKIAWIEQPADPRTLWTEHVAERPGPMETGRLVDVDGDGRLDLLPNGRDWAAWWEIVPGPEPRFIRHEFPRRASTHGVGLGDLNGDGRADLVCASGWAEAPVEPRTQPWVFHADFRLDPDASVPIAVHDVDADGDADVIWGRGHSTGLYWMERTGPSTWRRQAIDTSWSQCHTLELADLDGDGRFELIAAKRWLGHDGKDVGEWDPLVIYAYSFLPATRTWRRTALAAPGESGADLQVTLSDLDRDGDLDLIAAGRGGLGWLENLGPGEPERATAPASPAGLSPRRPLEWVGPDGAGMQPITRPADWGLRRADAVRRFEQVSGPLPGPERRAPLDVRVVEELRRPGDKYVRRRIRYQTEPGRWTTAWLLVPDGIKSPRAAMLCLHQTTAIGKDEPVGLGPKANLHYAHELAQRGYVCLAPDYPSFGELRDYDFTGDAFESGTMAGIWSHIRAVDLLESLPEVDPRRIGVIGHSLGGHNALFVAFFDQRLAACVTSCGFTGFHHYYGGDLKGWTSDRYLPAIRDRHGNDPDRVPFDFHELTAGIAPRGLFVCAPERDANFNADGVREVTEAARGVFRLLGAEARLVVRQPDAEHDFPTPVRDEAYAWLDQILKHEP